MVMRPWIWMRLWVSRMRPVGVWRQISSQLDLLRRTLDCQVFKSRREEDGRKDETFFVFFE